MRIFLYCKDSKNNFAADYDNKKISKTQLVTTPTVNRECVGITEEKGRLNCSLFLRCS